MGGEEFEKTHIGNKRAFLDRYLFHAVVNTVLPPVIFATMGNLFPAAMQFIAELSGPSMAKFFPSMNLGVAGLISVKDTAVRSCVGALKKTDDKIHFLKVSLSRRQAVLVVSVGWALQTANGALQEYAPDSEAHETMNALLGKDGLVAIASLLLPPLMLDSVFHSFTAEDGWAHRGVKAIVNLSRRAGSVGEHSGSSFKAYGAV